VSGDAALGTVGEHHLGANLTHAAGEFRHHAVEINAVQVGVGVVQHLGARDLQYLAGCGELLAAQRGQFLVSAGAPTVGSRLSGSEADDVGFDPALAIEQQGAAKVAGFIIGVSGDAEQSVHASSINQQPVVGSQYLLPGTHLTHTAVKVAARLMWQKETAPLKQKRLERAPAALGKEKFPVQVSAE